MLKHITLFFKGFAMGLANVVPGVSGGTIALLAGIFERFINSLKSFDAEALKLLFKGRFKEFAEHTDLLFLVVLIAGEAIGILTLSNLLNLIYNNISNGEFFVQAFFFGLIFISVYYIGKTIDKFTPQVVAFMLVGAAVAITVSLLTPASENDNMFYLVVCGAIAICDMLLPGISGSYTLILLGNYRLVMTEALPHFDLNILIPFGIGVVIGFLAFSRFLSWLMKNYKNQVTGVLTGFVFGSLLYLWPWKKPIYMHALNGEEVMDRHGKAIVEGYDRFMPDFNTDTFIALALIIVGIALLMSIEEIAARKSRKKIEENSGDSML